MNDILLPLSTWILSLVPGASADIASYQISPCAPAPKLDGRLNDPAWKKACTVKSFSLLGKPNQPGRVGVRTTAYLTFDQRFLFIAFDCEEPDIRELDLSVKEHDGPTWKNDGVEIMLNPSGDRTRYVQLAVNAAGVFMDAYIARPGTRLDLAYESHARVRSHLGHQRYSIEMAIPFEYLPLSSPTAIWTFHLARNRRKAGQLITSLRSSISGYHETARFDLLKGLDLKKFPIGIKSLDWGDGFQGIHLFKAELRNGSSSTVDSNCSLRLNGQSVIRKVRLAPSETRSIELPFRIAPTAAGKRIEFQLQVNQKTLQHRSVQLHEVPPLLGALDRRAFYLWHDRPVRIELPVQLAAGSRQKTRLHWEALDIAGNPAGQGWTSVPARRAVLRLFWLRWYPGIYQLRFRLMNGNKALATRKETVRLLPSPWGDNE